MTGELLDLQIEKASQLLQSARHAVVFTGAGISTPSGIPDFRSQGTGLWTRSNPMEVASLSAFRYHPDRFFNWLRPLAASIRGAGPNLAHSALAELEQAGMLQALITQNIDGLHQKAGSVRVLELHGALTRLVCPQCRRTYAAEDYWDAFVEDGAIPHCPSDRSNLKPGIVLFEEMLPAQVWNESEAEAQQADLMWVIGSSLEVSPANLLPAYTLEHGGRLIITTRSPTFLDDQAELVIHEDVVSVLPGIARKLFGQ
jgi:NAD-dependent deacetylase